VKRFVIQAKATVLVDIFHYVDAETMEEAAEVSDGIDYIDTLLGCNLSNSSGGLSFSSDVSSVQEFSVVDVVEDVPPHES
jgi:hypothetical protein